MLHVVKIPSSLEPVLRAVGVLAQADHVKAYAVGGCVRDWCLGKGGTVDVDVTVEGDGVLFAEHLAHTVRGPVLTHQQFGTATVVLKQQTEFSDKRQVTSDKEKQSRNNGLRMDIAMCRKETYAKPAAYPKVAAGTLQEDLHRRDFTINAMAMALAPDAFGTLIDPFRGAADLRGKRLRILHARSFKDDPSRILRGVRFAQRFGLGWERATQRALRAALASGVLGLLNQGRWRRELEQMQREPQPRRCLEALAALLKIRVSRSMTVAQLAAACDQAFAALKQAAHQTRMPSRPSERSR